MKLKIQIAIAIISSVLSGAAMAQWSANAALTTDYVFRGISQTLEDPAVQAGLDYSHESGFYVGSWASSIDFTDAPGADDGATLEWDFYFGYGGNITEFLSWDLGYIYFYYPGTNAGVDFNYGEVVGQLGFGENVTAMVGHSNDVFGSGQSGTYLNLNGSYDLGEEFSLSGEVARYDLDDLGSTYTHWSLGVSRPVNQFTFELTYHDSNGEDVLGDIAGSRLVFSVSVDAEL